MNSASKCASEVNMMIDYEGIASLRKAMKWGYLALNSNFR